MAAIGTSPIVLKETAGHANVATTENYVHLAGVVFRDEAAALESRLFGADLVPSDVPQPYDVG